MGRFKRKIRVPKVLTIDIQMVFFWKSTSRIFHGNTTSLVNHKISNKPDVKSTDSLYNKYVGEETDVI